MSKYSPASRKAIVKKIGALSLDEKKEVFKIINNNDVKYMENVNGVYIMFNNVDDLLIDEIVQFLDFCKENKAKLASKDNEQMIQKHLFFGDKDDQNEEEEDSSKFSTQTDNKYLAKASTQTELDKYGLNIDEDHDEQEVVINKTKPKYSRIKAKIIKK